MRRRDIVNLKREAWKEIEKLEIVAAQPEGSIIKQSPWYLNDDKKGSIFYKLALRASAARTSQTELVRRSTFILMCSLTIIAGMIWGSMYVVLNEPAAAVMPFLYSSMNGSSLLLCTKEGLYSKLVILQLCLIFILPFAVHFALGGLQESGGVMIWSFLAPLGAAFFRSAAESIIWYKFYALCTICIMFIDLNGFSSLAESLPSTLSTCWAINIIGVTLIIFSASYLYCKELENEYVKSEELLSNILPMAIASRLKGGELPIIDNFEGVTILFADLVGFTKAAAEISPNILIGGFLRDAFSHFDRLVERRGLEKIKTIGDAYMVVAGLERHENHHTVETMCLAREMFVELEKVNEKYNFNFQIRVGVHTGPVIAGVIGVKKFAYDVWGNSVNTASRMESHGIPGYVHMSQDMYDAVYNLNEFRFTCRGESFIKGLGNMVTYTAEPININNGKIYK